MCYAFLFKNTCPGPIPAVVNSALPDYQHPFSAYKAIHVSLSSQICFLLINTYIRCMEYRSLHFESPIGSQIVIGRQSERLIICLLAFDGYVRFSASPALNRRIMLSDQAWPEAWIPNENDQIQHRSPGLMLSDSMITPNPTPGYKDSANS